MATRWPEMRVRIPPGAWMSLLLSVVRCQVQRSLRRAYHSYRGVLPSVISKPLQCGDLGPLGLSAISLLKPTGYVMRHQFNIQQLYVLPTLYLCVLYLSENKQRLVPLTA